MKRAARALGEAPKLKRGKWTNPGAADEPDGDYKESQAAAKQLEAGHGTEVPCSKTVESLESRHAHPRDKHILFDEPSHTYTVHGEGGYVSVTSIKERYFEKFDAKAVAQKMITKPAFRTNKAYVALLADDPPADVLVQRITTQWEEYGRAQSDLGTTMHNFIENYYNGKKQTVPVECIRELSYFSRFKTLMKQRNLRPYRTEWRIYDEETRVCGTIDMIYYNPATQTYHMVDWKRSKKISSFGYRKRGRGPCSYLDDCNLSHYTLQLNVYKYILEKHYGIVIHDMALGVFHPNNASYQHIELIDIQHTVRAIMQERLKDHGQIGVETSPA